MPTPANTINESTTGICGFTSTAFVGSPATQHCVQVGGSTTSTLVSVTNGTTGQVLTAVTGLDPVWSNAANTTWTDVTSATQALLASNGYVTDRSGGVVYTLPASATLGDEIQIVGKLGLTTITPNANQQIVMGSASGTVGVTGTAVGTNLGDCVVLIAITAGASSVWRAESFVGNWTLN